MACVIREAPAVAIGGGVGAVLPVPLLATFLRFTGATLRIFTRGGWGATPCPGFEAAGAAVVSEIFLPLLKYSYFTKFRYTFTLEFY